MYRAAPSPTPRRALLCSGVFVAWTRASPCPSLQPDLKWKCAVGVSGAAAGGGARQGASCPPCPASTLQFLLSLLGPALSSPCCPHVFSAWERSLFHSDTSATPEQSQDTRTRGQGARTVPSGCRRLRPCTLRARNISGFKMEQGRWFTHEQIHRAESTHPEFSAACLDCCAPYPQRLLRDWGAETLRQPSTLLSESSQPRSCTSGQRKEEFPLENPGGTCESPQLCALSGPGTHRVSCAPVALSQGPECICLALLFCFPSGLCKVFPAGPA